MPSQYTLTSTFQISLVDAVKCAVPNTSASQQTATSAVHKSSEPRQPSLLKKTRLLQTAGAEFEKNVLHLDTGANFSNSSAIEMSAVESSLQQKSNIYTAMALAKAMVPHNQQQTELRNHRERGAVRIKAIAREFLRPKKK